MSIEVVPLDSATEKIFWRHVYQDILQYHFFIFDWKFRRDSTQILLALKQNKIDGVMLIYRQNTVQLRGSLKSAETLLGHLDLEKAEIQGLREHENVILKRYKPSTIHDMMLMALNKGDERLYLKHPVTKLVISDAEEIAALMREANPEFWAEIAADRIITSMEDMLWLGIRDKEQLLSVGNTRLTDFGCNIGVVATHKSHRNEGYATTIVSALLKEIFQKSEVALIHVLHDNLPARHVYEKVGFKPYATYFLMKGGKRRTPNNQQ